MFSQPSSRSLYSQLHLVTYGLKSVPGTQHSESLPPNRELSRVEGYEITGYVLPGTHHNAGGKGSVQRAGGLPVFIFSYFYIRLSVGQRALGESSPAKNKSQNKKNRSG